MTDHGGHKCDGTRNINGIHCGLSKEGVCIALDEVQTRCPRFMHAHAERTEAELRAAKGELNEAHAQYDELHKTADDAMIGYNAARDRWEAERRTLNAERAEIATKLSRTRDKHDELQKVADAWQRHYGDRGTEIDSLNDCIRDREKELEKAALQIVAHEEKIATHEEVLKQRTVVEDKVIGELTAELEEAQKLCAGHAEVLAQVAAHEGKVAVHERVLNERLATATKARDYAQKKWAEFEDECAKEIKTWKGVYERMKIVSERWQRNYDTKVKIVDTLQIERSKLLDTIEMKEATIRDRDREIGERKEQIVKLEKIHQGHDEHAAECAHEIADLKAERALHATYEGKNYWAWDSEEHANGLASLTCPILIDAYQMRAIIEARDSALRELATHKKLVDKGFNWMDKCTKFEKRVKDLEVIRDSLHVAVESQSLLCSTIESHRDVLKIELAQVHTKWEKAEKEGSEHYAMAVGEAEHRGELEVKLKVTEERLKRTEHLIRTAVIAAGVKMGHREQMTHTARVQAIMDAIIRSEHAISWSTLDERAAFQSDIAVRDHELKALRKDRNAARGQVGALTDSLMGEAQENAQLNARIKNQAEYFKRRRDEITSLSTRLTEALIKVEEMQRWLHSAPKHPLLVKLSEKKSQEITEEPVPAEEVVAPSPAAQLHANVAEVLKSDLAKELEKKIAANIRLWASLVIAQAACVATKRECACNDGMVEVSARVRDGSITYSASHRMPCPTCSEARAVVETQVPEEKRDEGEKEGKGSTQSKL